MLSKTSTAARPPKRGRRRGAGTGPCGAGMPIACESAEVTKSIREYTSTATSADTGRRRRPARSRARPSPPRVRVPSNARTLLVRRDPPAPKAKRAPRVRKRAAPGESTAKRAEAFRAALAAEPDMTRADLARRLGVSRAWVTRVLGARTSHAGPGTTRSIVGADLACPP